MGLIIGFSTPSVSGKKAYEDLFEMDPTASNVEALCVLFLDSRVQEEVSKEGRFLSRSITRLLVV